MEKLEITTPEGYKRVESVKDGTTYITFKKIENKTIEECWEEVVKNTFCNKTAYWIHPNSKLDFGKHESIDDIHLYKNTHLTEERAEAFLYLQALITARDYYNQGWVADWTCESTKKYCIQSYKGVLYKEIYAQTSKILHFKTAEIRDKFFKDFEEWIEIVHKDGLI